MKKYLKDVAVLGCLIVTAATTHKVFAEDVLATDFPSDPPIASLIAKIPGEPIEVRWLPGVKVIRYDESRLELDKTMPAVRAAYDQWCKAKSARILQPRNGNCAPTRKGFGCAVGELQYSGMGSDFERGLFDAARGSGDKVSVMWPKASWLISKNVLFNVFVNKGADEVAVVGGLQRCVTEQSQLLGAMAFVSINENNDLLFLNPGEYEALKQRGAELSKMAADKKRQEEQNQKTQDAAAIAALTPGSRVLHARSGWQGMVIEMKPPLALIQWTKYGSKSTEWNRLDELRMDGRQ